MQGPIQNLKHLHFSHYTQSSETDDGIRKLIHQIRTAEQGNSNGLLYDTDLRDINTYYLKSGGNFWVCSQDETIVGTVGLVPAGLDRRVFVLRKMFVKKEFRGEEFAVSKNLLRVCIEYAKANSVASIVLGTNHSYLAAIKFYGKNGFIEISKEEFPANRANELDDVFYKLIV